MGWRFTTWASRSVAGKGSAPRPVDGAKFRAGWEWAFRATRRTPTPAADAVLDQINRWHVQRTAAEIERLLADANPPKSPRTRKARS